MLRCYWWKDNIIKDNKEWNKELVWCGRNIRKREKWRETIYKDEMRWVGLIVTDEGFPYEEANDMRCDKSVTISLLIITITNICRDYTVSVGCWWTLCICSATTPLFIYLTPRKSFTKLIMTWDLTLIVSNHGIALQCMLTCKHLRERTTHTNLSFKSGQHGQEYFKIMAKKGHL